MSNGLPGKRLGFASFFSGAKETSVDVPFPARSPPLSRSITSVTKSLPSSVTVSAEHSLRGESATTGSRHASSSHRGAAHSSTKAPSSSKRNFKCIADPELDKSLPKSSKAVFRYNGKSVCTEISENDPSLIGYRTVKSP